MIDITKNIGLVPVKTLADMSFSIPDYQRGYRWEKEQVEDLLKDIQAFIDKKPPEKEVYLLQPIVLSARGDKCSKEFSVVDGQQRLTTVYLLLRYLNSSKKFSIEYQTRKNSWEFLKSINSASLETARDNVDYYHMYNAYKNIEEWFKDKHDNLKKYRDTLLRKVCFIYYIVEKEHEIEVFTRLNIGKIPLTDSELIKAMILNRSNFSSYSDEEKKVKQHKIAEEWNQIENTLQNDEFWLFIHSKSYDKPTRIDYLLELMMKNNTFELKNNRKYINDEHGLYKYFDAVVDDNRNNGKSIEDLWQTIKDTIMIFREWYNDYRLYHYIGYLVAVKKKDAESYIAKLFEDWHDTNDKDKFIVKLQKEIVETLKIDKNTSDSSRPDEKKHNFLEHLINDKSLRKEKVYSEVKNKKDIAEYLYQTRFEDNGYTKRCCVNILLLHDVESVIQYNDKLVANDKYGVPVLNRFPFHLYCLDTWDVEHVRPNSDDDLDREQDRLIYLLMANRYYAIDGVKEKIREYVNDNSVALKNNYKQIDEYDSVVRSQMSSKDRLFAEITKTIEETGVKALEDDDKNRIWNYTLLDSSTNREYGNRIFPYKRAYIAEKEKGRKLYFGIKENPSFDDRDQNSYRYALVESNECKNEIVQLLLRYDESNNEQKEKIKKYVNSINKDSPIYELKEKADVQKPTVAIVDKDKCNKYSLEYVLKRNRIDNHGMQFRLSERTETAPFVLASTKNVFTKYYSKKITTMMHWTKDDAEYYWEDIKTTLHTYFDMLNVEFDKDCEG